MGEYNYPQREMVLPSRHIPTEKEIRLWKETICYTGAGGRIAKTYPTPFYLYDEKASAKMLND